MYISDHCRKYDIQVLEKHINRFPLIKIPKTLISFNPQPHSKQEDAAVNRQYPHLCDNIVVFCDFTPFSNWCDLLTNVYANLFKKATGKLISVRMIQYTDLKICIVREKSPWVYSKKSTVLHAGKGLFAIRHIPKDTQVCICFEHINQQPCMYDDEGYLANHSKKRKNLNCVVKRTRQGCKTAFYVAARNIHANEELFFDYTLLKSQYPEWSQITFIDKS